MKKTLAMMAAVLVTLVPNISYARDLEKEIEDHATLLSVVEALQIPVNFNNAVCKQFPHYYGAYHIGGEDFVVCNRGGQEEVLDTVRHEAWHVYQDIKDCKIKDLTALQPVMSNGAVPAAYKQPATKAYKPSDVASESEAQWAADTFSAATIGNLILQKVDECKITLIEPNN